MDTLKVVLGEEHFMVYSIEIIPKEVICLARRREEPVWLGEKRARGVGVM